MWAAFLSRLPGWSDITMLFGLNLLIHSTLIIFIGLGGLYILRMQRRGTASQSLLLRFCLIAVLITPPALFISSAAGVRGLYVPIPLPRIQSAAAPVETEQAYPPESPKPTAGGQSSRKENSAGQQPAGKIQAAEPFTEQPPVTTAPVKPHSVQSPPKSAPFQKKAVIPHTSSNNSLPSIPILFSLTWIVLSLFLVLRFGAITLYIRRIIRLASPAEPRHTALCRKVAGELGISAPLVLQSPYVTSILLTGLFRPAILLPSGGNEIALATREVFLHELAHLARRDPLWLHLCQLAKIIIPFQPLLWALARHIEELSDFACDDFVIRHTGLNRPYATQLYNIARSFQPRGIEASAGSGILSARFPLLRRIDRILDNSYSRRITVSANEVMSFSILFLCAVTFTGFIGLRAEGAVGRTYASEQRLQDGGKQAVKRPSLFHTALPAVLAGHTVMQEQAAAEEGRVEETIRKEKSKKDPSPSADAVLPASETTPEESTVPATLAQANMGQEFKQETAPMMQPAVSQRNSDPKNGENASHSEKTSDISGDASRLIEGKNAREAFASADSLQKTVQTGFVSLSNRGNTPQKTFIAPGKFTLNINTKDNSSNYQLSQEMMVNLQRGQTNPVWSPEGKRVAFTDYYGYSVWTVSLERRDLRLIFDSKATEVNGFLRTIGFTPDGREILFVNYIPSRSGKTVPAIQAVDVITGNIRTVMEQASDGSYSPNGRYFAYVSWTADYFQCATRLFNYSYESLCSTILLYDTQTGKTRSLAENGTSPSFTPDGSAVFYSGKDNEGKLQLFRVPVSGGSPVQLTSDGNWRTPKLSPSGDWILSSGRSMDGKWPKAQLRFYHVKTGKSYDIFPESPFHVEAGGWSQDSGHVICTVLTPLVIDEGMMVGGPYMYISHFELNGAEKEAEVKSGKPSIFSFIGNFPNPFNPSTSIRFSLASPGRVDLEIFNSIGQKVRTLISESRPAGTHNVVWDGKNDHGMPVSSGVYIARLKGEGKVESRRMTLTK